MLSTFSLMSTTLNAHSTSKLFGTKFGNGKTGRSFKEAVGFAEYFLCASQQSPLRVKEDQLRQLFAEDPTHLRDLWEPLKDRIHSTRRQYTFSLFAQTLIAAAAWVLTIIGSYATSLGQPAEALLLSSGTLWTWLVPLVLGWMAAGVQSRENTVEDAIRGEVKHERDVPFKALRVGSGFVECPTTIHNALWSDVQGDERRQGPIFKYARIFTYPKLRDRIAREFEKKLRALDEDGTQARFIEPIERVSSLRNRHDPRDSAQGSSLQDASSEHSQAISTSSQVPSRVNTIQLEHAASFSTVDEPYMTWEDVTLSADWKWNFVIANVIAAFLLWGVTGAAIVIAYLTEVRGLGCRSGSYLLYGVLATSAHILLLTSVFLSNHVMLIYQKERKESFGRVNEKKPRDVIQWIGRLAVFTRFLGKFIAAANAIWLIVGSLFELIGFYESCWCLGTVLQLGKNSWVVLFVSDNRIRQEAEPSWVGGLAMSLLTMGLTYWIFRAYSWGTKN